MESLRWRKLAGGRGTVVIPAEVKVIGYTNIEFFSRMHGQKERFRSLLLLLFLFGWLVFNWIDTVRHLVEYYNPLPAGDYWRVVEDLSAFKNFDLSPLWRQHNEHRIVFPEVIFAIDMLCFEGRQLLPAILNFCFHFTTWLVLARVAWQERSVPPLTRIIAILLAGIAMGWSLNSFVTGLPFLLQWTLLQLAVILALVCSLALRVQIIRFG